MPVSEIDIIRACVKQPVYAQNVYTDILSSQDPTHSHDERDANARKEMIKLFYKVWSGFTKYIKS